VMSMSVRLFAFSLHIADGRGLVHSWRRSDMLFTSGFMEVGVIIAQ